MKHVIMLLHDGKYSNNRVANPTLQQFRTSPNATAVDARAKEKKLFTSGRPHVGRDLQRDTLDSSANP